MKLPIHVVNAFVCGPFTGNPAAVIVTDSALPDDLMQQIAAQNNLSETAFVVTGEQPFHLRWFTPVKEIPLCGHATLATAHVLYAQGVVEAGPIRFNSLSGELSVERKGEALQLNFPVLPVRSIDISFTQVAEALNCSVDSIELCLQARVLVVVLNDEQTVANLKPNKERIAQLHPFAVMVTAPGESVDFVARFFAPNAGIDEDPVTGSVYCTLAPYWEKRLGKSHLSARQLSRRTGQIHCEVMGDRVLISGKTQRYLNGEIVV
ncbi:PhzF family phenazine biosynthesis protein [Marinimicrobium sp. ABcell2]|uniref:PhzF family phenazine biosynthesis protein n=1 Tax=Marinimicrobium sp. ABcell2 TaxID=3069751 RepID=UPI0027B6792C|nr:PhzF family phenazine biosynthesis protein [Marinimicrobium sp. ABcell2]MDQ2076721.1 PhzF family phenazine biosynthesis protein [Marinimicrobium sp. ABcell2]